MSYDPASQGPYRPPDPARIAAYARARVVAPAVLLIGVALMNLAVSAILASIGFFFARLPPDRFERILAEQQPAQWEHLQGAGWTAADVLRVYVVGGYSSGAVTGFLALLTLAGAVQMLKLRSFGLAVVGAIAAALPCLSPSGCCLFGEIVGVWALIVLLDADVRSAFP